MKHSKILIFLLILISSYFILEVFNDKEAINYINKITTSTILKIQTKATSILLGLSINIKDTPKIYISSPLNKTYNYNNLIELNFTASTVNPANLDKIFYNIDNGINTTITGNTTFSVNLTTSHILKLFANDTAGNINSSSVTFSINLSKGHDVDFGNFNEGQTTNFSRFNITELQNLSNVKIEKLDRGLISFIDSINISKELNISKYINISFNRIEVQSDFLFEFNKSATLKIYNLTFTNPRILFNDQVCPISICTKNSYSNGILSFNVTHFTTYSSEETSSSGGSGSSSGGGGSGSSGGGKADLSDFSVSTNLIKVSLLQGETKIEVIGVENTGESTLNLAIDLKDIKDFLIFPGGVSKYELNLRPGEKQSIQLIFNAAKDYKSGVYSGKIVVSSNLIQKIIPVIIEVESSKKIFDVDIEIKNKKVVKGDDLTADIIIFNLGRDLGRVDTQVEFGIRSLKGNIITKQDIRIAVETQASFTESILIPTDLEEGKYVAYAIVTFDSEIGIATEFFEVGSSPEEVHYPKSYDFISTAYIYFIPGLISIIMILVILEYLKHHYKRKEILKVETKAEPQKRFFIKLKDMLKGKKVIKEKFDINKFLKETDEHGGHKETLENELKILKQNYELGLISKEEYLKNKNKVERKLRF